MLTLALAVLLTLTDPGSDLGNGQVRPPTAAVGRPNGALDVTQFQLYDSETVNFSLTFTSLANPFNLRHGFTFPIIEIYVDDQSGTGSTTLLPGSGMRLPTGASWKYAFKLTGDTLQVFEATQGGWQDVTTRYPTTLSVQGTTIMVSSSVPRPQKPDFFGMVGSYNSFSETGWTPLSRSESPWAYSSDTQIPAALDVIAPTFEAQRSALDTGVLPAIRPPRPVNPWIFVMVGGVLIAMLGVVLRFWPSEARSVTAPKIKTPTTPSQSKGPSAQIGPYKPEPLKSRSAALKNIVGDKITPLPETGPDELTPGQLMAAERTRAMIASDRKARDTGETLVDKTLLNKAMIDKTLTGQSEPNDQAETSESSEDSESTTKIDKTVLADELLAEETLAETLLAKKTPLDEPKQAVRLSEPLKSSGAASKVDLTIKQAEIFGAAKPKATTPDEEDVSSSAIPLFQTPSGATPNPQPKAQFAASEVWHEDEEEFDFLWAKKDDLPEAKSSQPKKPTSENS
jgi:hypothetical protein